MIMQTTFKHFIFSLVYKIFEMFPTQNLLHCLPQRDPKLPFGYIGFTLLNLQIKKKTNFKILVAHTADALTDAQRPLNIQHGLTGRVQDLVLRGYPAETRCK